MRCAKFGVAVFKASMLDWGGQSAMGIYALCYIYMKLIWCNGFAEIYAQLEGAHLPWVYMHCSTYI